MHKKNILSIALRSFQTHTNRHTNTLTPFLFTQPLSGCVSDGADVSIRLGTLEPRALGWPLERRARTCPFNRAGGTQSLECAPDSALLYTPVHLRVYAGTCTNTHKCVAQSSDRVQLNQYKNAQMMRVYFKSYFAVCANRRRPLR